MSRGFIGPFDAGEIERFLASCLYEPEAFLIDEVTRVDRAERVVEARMDTTRPLPYTAMQRPSETHPAHVAAAELLMLTGNLGFVHAWWIHGCHFDEGWAGFGNRIHRADFKSLARLGPPLDLHSRETKTRAGEKRVVMRMEFEFSQEGQRVYTGDQSAMFFRERPLDD